MQWVVEFVQSIFHTTYRAKIGYNPPHVPLSHAEQIQRSANALLGVWKGVE